LARLGHPPADDSALALYIGRLHYFFGSFSDAGPFFRRAADLARKVVPVDHRHVALAEGAVCMAMEDWDQRIACSRKAVELAKAAFGPEHPEVGAFYGNLGLVLNWKRPHPPEACQLIRKGMDLMKGPDQSGPRAIKSLLNLAECVEKQGNVEEARRLYEEALSLNTTVASRALVLQGYSLLLAKHLDLSAGLARAREAVAAYESTHGPGSDDTVVGRTNVAMMLADTGRLDEALQELDESIAQCRKQGTVASGLGHLHGYRAEILAMMKRPEAALRSAEEGMRVLRELAIPDRELGVILHAMAVAHLQLGQVDEAVAKLERALQLREETVDYADTRADLQFALARALVRKGRDRARACDLARKAATTYGLYVRKRPQKLDSERWLTRQGCAVGA
jgi:tetratricopeptide (TPR) repeat protein